MGDKSTIPVGDKPDGGAHEASGSASPPSTYVSVLKLTIPWTHATIEGGVKVYLFLAETVSE